MWHGGGWLWGQVLPWLWLRPGDEFAIEHMRLYGSSHPQGFIFGLSGVLYDGVVSWSFFENIAVFTAVDDDIVVHRLTVETA